jgi:hypothetical protein
MQYEWHFKHTQHNLHSYYYSQEMEIFQHGIKIHQFLVVLQVITIILSPSPWEGGGGNRDGMHTDKRDDNISRPSFVECLNE